MSDKPLVGTREVQRLTVVRSVLGVLWVLVKVGKWRSEREIERLKRRWMMWDKHSSRAQVYIATRRYTDDERNSAVAALVFISMGV